MSIRSIRGATTATNNDEDQILEATKELLFEIFSKNNVDIGDIINITFTATKDLTKVYPAVAARKMGIIYAGLLCYQELYVENSLKKCIRVMVNIESDIEQKHIKHIYLNDAVKLRPDIMQNKYVSIAIDGPNGSGKSTVAKEVAKALGFNYVDTGAMYRAVGYYCSERGIDLDKHEDVTDVLCDIDLKIQYENGEQLIFLNGQNITNETRSQKRAEGASKAGTIEKVREMLVTFQQELANRENIVMDGRDIGTVVLPDADLKIFLNADISERAKRRVAELLSRGFKAEYEQVKKEIEERDFRDINRKISPLKKADDAIVLDTTYLTAKQVREHVLKLFYNIAK